MAQSTRNSGPSISVVITAYAEGEILVEAVESALLQTRPPLEVVIVNDASPDEATNAICKRLSRRKNLHVVWRAENGGPSAAREEGFAAARGEIFVPLDGDDLLPSDALQKIGAAFAAHPDAGLIYGDYLREEEAGEQRKVVVGEVSLAEMLRSRGLHPGSRWKLLGTSPLRRSLWQAVGGCDPTFGADDLHDVEFLLRALSAPGFAAIYLPETIYIWRKHLGRNTRRVTPLSWRRVVEKHLALYVRHGLEARAHELLLMGAKAAGDQEAMRQHKAALRRCLLRGDVSPSAFGVYLLPAPLLRWAAERLGKRR